jgi:hypothetical protein
MCRWLIVVLFVLYLPQIHAATPATSGIACRPCGVAGNQ